MSQGITPRQGELLKLIASLTRDGVPPCYAKLAASMETSRGDIHRMLTCLRERGHVTWTYGRHRSLRLVDPLAGKSRGELLALRKDIDRALMEQGA